MLTIRAQTIEWRGKSDGRQKQQLRRKEGGKSVWLVKRQLLARLG